MDLGTSAASGISVPVGSECQQEGRGIWLFSLWGRQEQPLHVLPLWNTPITPGRNPQTASSGNRDINHAMLLINCFRLRFYSWKLISTGVFRDQGSACVYVIVCWKYSTDIYTAQEVLESALRWELCLWDRWFCSRGLKNTLANSSKLFYRTLLPYSSVN